MRMRQLPLSRILALPSATRTAILHRILLPRMRTNHPSSVLQSSSFAPLQYRIPVARRISAMDKKTNRPINIDKLDPRERKRKDIQELFLRIYTSYKDGNHFMEIPSVSSEQLGHLRKIISKFPNLLGKPHFSYFGRTGLLVMKWPAPAHEWPMRTLDTIFQDEAIRLPYPDDLVIGCIHHNTALVLKEDIIMPDLLLEFGAGDDGGAEPIHPVICQIPFSQTFQSARDELNLLAKEVPSLCMAVILDVVEKPSYRRPLPKSHAYMTLSKEALMSQSTFYDRRSKDTGPSPGRVEVCGHTWCSVAEVGYHVWVKPPGSDNLRLDAEVGENYAFCYSHDEVGRQKVEAMLLKGLGEVKRSVVSLCKTVIRSGMHSPCDLTPLSGHATKLPVSLLSFDKDIKKGAGATSYLRYKQWYLGLSEDGGSRRPVAATAEGGQGLKTHRKARH